MRTRHHPLASRGPILARGLTRQHGTIAALFAGMLVFILAMCGLALDLGQLYNRKAEMQNVADTLALAAAGELNGTAAGIEEAVRQATLRLTEPHEKLTYRYSELSLDWSPAAIKFSSAPDGEWRDAGAAEVDAGTMLYVKVDTAELKAEYGAISTLFMHVVSPALAVVSTSASAIAGRSSINVVPLAVCALRPDDPRLDHSGELVEYGFRRGISYDLMQLNSAASAPPRNFLINPFAAPGTSTASPVTDLAIVKPFVCTGTMPMTRVTGGALTVGQPFPLGTLVDQLNSRFDSYTPPCEQFSSPPDANVKEYVFNTTVAADRWMNAIPTGQTAQGTTAENKLWTVADPLTTPAGTTATMYGQVWAFTPAVRYSAAVPASGESRYATSDWPALYRGAKNKTTGYPANTTPYDATSGSTFRSPPSGRRGIRGRRVLNVPLLSCPVSGSSATVLAIGKFFMTVHATGTSLPAEFAGVVDEASVGGKVELYQ
jgi:hypothetical protein